MQDEGSVQDVRDALRREKYLRFSAVGNFPEQTPFEQHFRCSEGQLRPANLYNRVEVC